MINLSEGVDYSYKGGVPGLYDEKGRLIKKAEELTPQQLSDFEKDYIRRRGRQQIDVDRQVVDLERKSQRKQQPSSTATGASQTPSGSNRWYISGASGGKAAFGAGGGIAAMKADPSLTAAEVQRRGMVALRAKQNQQPPSTSGTPPASQPPATRPPAQPPASSRPAPPPPTSTAPKPPESAQTGNRQADLGTWAKANKEMIQKVGTARQKEILAATQAGIPIPPVKKLGENLNNTQSSLEVHRTMNAQITETYDAYELVLEYLLETGHAETVNEANYIMLQMDSDMIGNIVEGMVKYLQD